ncbi:hypothetical protein [Synechococcus sp. CBW1107]|uniref:hypothetical protein n=1 Tax=Synechococcus sp. CBW1107 TaxID=2789857 RepID=UPI002AD423D8|nr:hypothetical protein [Synechococcus sp. CBW1107]
MTDFIAGGMVAIASGVVGALTTYVLRRQEKTWARAASDIPFLAEQIVDYYREEQIMLERLGNAEGKSPNTLKVEIRDQVNKERGKWLTETDARSMIEAWARRL